MRKNIVAGNWKMNTTLNEGVGLAKDVNEALKNVTPKCDVVICVPFTHLQRNRNDRLLSFTLNRSRSSCRP